MYENENQADDSFPQPPLEPKGNATIAWLIILLVVGGIVYWQNFRDRPNVKPSEVADPLMEVQGKLLHGLIQFSPLPEKDVLRQLRELRAGGPALHLRSVILIGDLLTPELALEELEALKESLADRKAGPAFSEADLIPILEKMYKDYQADKLDAPSLTAEEKEKLEEELGRWYGGLALHPPTKEDDPVRKALLEQAKTGFFVMAGGAGGGLCLCGLGAFGLILFLIFFGKGDITHHFSPEPSRGGIYAETFAIWLILFSALLFGAPYLRPLFPGVHPLLISFVFSFLSLVSLIWPCCRGLTWREVRQDIGLHGGVNPIVEVLCGIATYCMAIPLAVIGFLIMFLLLAIQRATGIEGGPPGHPIIQEIGSAGSIDKLLIILVACVAAPVVEEIMFRGLLYRQLRDQTSKGFGFTLSFLCSGLVTGILFAVIHPQGLVATPALAALAFGFAIGREWRGSLISCIVAHAIHNGVLMMLAFALLSK